MYLDVVEKPSHESIPNVEVPRRMKCPAKLLQSPVHLGTVAGHGRRDPV